MNRTYAKYATANNKVYYESEKGNFEKFLRSKHGKNIDNAVFCGNQVFGDTWKKENLEHICFGVYYEKK